MPKEKFDYFKSMAELEEIAAKVEDPKTRLDDIGGLVSGSKEIIESCRKYLRTIRSEVENIEEQS